MNEQQARSMIDLEWDGVILYHGTSSVAVEGILKEGLIPKGGKGCDAWTIKAGLDRLWFHPGFIWERPFVFMAAHPEKAMRYAQCAASVTGGNPVIIEVRVPNAHIPKLSADFHAWMFKGTIPPGWVSVYSNDRKTTR
jgi:hypothetical protein